MRKLFVAIFATMLPLAAAWADDVAKNTTTGTSYLTLQDAFYEANAGDVIELLGDVDATGDESFSEDFNLGIEAGITLEGNNHTLTVNRRGISVARQSSNSRMKGASAKAPVNTIDVTIKNLTIKNVATQVRGKGGQLINTRGGIGTLTLDNVIFDTQGTAYNKDVRPLVIGGNQSIAATVNITNCKFATPTAPTNYNSIAINVLNPVTMNIQGTTINAQYVINMAGADSSYGSQGSEVTFDGSTVTATEGAAVLFDADNMGTGANGSTVTLTGETKVTTPTADWYDMGDTANNTIVWEHFATNYISATKYETKPTIQIATVADLQALAELCNNSSTAGQTVGNTYELTDDLDLSGVAWTPAGGLDSYSGTAFKGTFDGMGHTISNLTCTDTHAKYATAALFGATASYAVIKNLTLTNVNIHSTHYAAAFVAYEGSENYYTTIENCHVKGGSIVSTPELINGEYDNGDKVGGIVGYSVRTDIKNCSVEDVTLQGYRDIGGLAGFLQNKGAVIEGNTVANVTIIQSDENGYKTNSDGSLQDMSSTVGQVVGGRSGDAVKEQANDPSKNVADNVTIESTGILAKIGDAKFSTVSAAVAAATEGQTVEICMAGIYTLPTISKNITIKGTVEGVIFNCEGSGNIAAIPNGATFENVTMNFGTNDYHGFQHAGKITMNGCTLNGKFFSYADMDFVGCTFNAPDTEESGYTSKDYSMWAYAGNLTYTDCTFNCNGKCINVYKESCETLYSVTAINCTFNSETANKAAFNVKATNGSNPLKYKVIIEDCEATGLWPAASESETLVVLNGLAQVDDINSSVASDIEVIKIEEGVETVLYTTRIAEYAGNRYSTLQEALDAAEAADDADIVINLLNDATLDITARANVLSIGTANTETITVNGNNHTLNFNKKNSDWDDVSTANDDQTKLILNDMTLTDSGYNNGPWNSYDINFSCNVELNNVISTKALAFKNDATLNKVTVNDNNDVYGIWIQTNGQNVTMKDVTVNVPNGRGIAVKDQYVTEAPAETTSLSVENVTFTTAKKAAILVTAQYGAEITASNLDITAVAADSENALWVSDDRANLYGEVTLTGDATMIPEGGVEAYSVVRKTGDKVEGYYKELPSALAEAKADQTIELKADFELTETKNTAETPVYFEANDHKVTLTEGVKVYAKENTYAEVFTTADAAVSSIEVTEATNAYVYEATAVYYAQIGGNKYRSLQAALDDVAKAYDNATEVTINIIRDIDEETVTVKEYKNFKVTIDGANTSDAGNYKFSGQMVLDGMRTAGGSIGNGASITLQNIAFVQGANKDAITSPSNSYTHNVTIQNCSYEGNAEWTGTWFVNMLDVAYYFNINNITAKNTRLLSGKGFNKYNEEGYGLVLEDVTATEGITAVFNNLKTNGEVIIQNNTIDATKYVLRDAPEAYEGTITLKDNNFTTTTEGDDEGVIYTRRPADTTPHILVESGIYVGKLAQKTENHVVAISGGHFSVDLSQDAYKDFIANLYYGESNLYPETPDAPNGVKHYPFVIAGAEVETGYATFADAVAAVQNGETIKMLDNVEMAVDLTSTLESGDKFTLTFGEYNITKNDYFLKLNRGVSVTTDKETDMFAPVNAADMVTVSGTYTYTVVSKESEGIFELADGTACPYALESDVQAEKVTYTRTIKASQVDKFQPWFVPFDYTITEDDLNNFTFYKINMIANASSAGESSEATDDVWIFLNKMGAGDVLHGNKPYFFKPNTAGDYEFTSEGVTMMAQASGVILQAATTTATYSFYGTYATVSLAPSEEHRDYYMSGGGLNYPLTKTISLGAYRWYLRMEAKSGLDYARSIGLMEGEGDSATSLRTIVTGEEEDTYYTLDGVKVQTPGKGMLIKKSADGTIKKVLIK